MSFPVKFTSTLTGAISDLDVLIQGVLVPSPGYKVNLTEDYSDHGELSVKFQISGDNGADFNIAYSCSTAGKDASDPNQPSPIKGTIARNGYLELTLSIDV
ncbi:hypothetical protein [Puia dinghuensis]|uniref:Uncharacterized protein n=1 Tax=Puia dinghuensis TaxID=1792502 RepID=A0A8J2UJ32_9BACT|nr:hypothetical protein [Puia dinghuensis]GGB23246.1 hypothetical protein GCM10011511_53940 [Puia dinghuensis]